MWTVAGILLVVSGIVFPMGLVAWLSGRMNRAPRPSSRQVGLILALNGLLPVGMVTLGLGLMSGQFWTLPWLRSVALAAWAAALIVVVALWVATWRQRRHHGR